MLGVLVLISFIALGAYSKEDCYPRDYGQGTIVCVCNVTHCDDIDPFNKTEKGVVNIYETSRTGLRFNLTQVQVGYKHPGVVNISETISINRNETLQKIIGFGGAFTDGSGYVISLLPESLQNRIIKDYYSERGLEYNLNRLTMGGADYSLRPYTYDDDHVDDFNLTYFALQPEDLNYKIPYMKKAQEVSPHKQLFFGSPWASPAWMKTNNEINHGGYLKGTDLERNAGPGTQYYKIFADYFVKFLDAYKQQGIEMWGVTAENEPRAGDNPTYSFNSLGFTKELQRDFVKKDLGPALKAAGYGPDKLNLMICDDQRDVIYEWSKTIYSDNETLEYVAGAAFHWYYNTPENLQDLDKTHQVNPNKFILATEACYDFGLNYIPPLGNWPSLEAFANDIITDLNHWTAGWVAWNLAVDLEGGPNWANLHSDNPIVANPDQQEYYKQPAFYGLGHFSKFILPNSTRLGFSQQLNSDQLVTTVFQRPDNGTVVVVLNTRDDTVEYNVVDSGQQLLSNVIQGHAIQTYIYYNN